MEKKVNLLFFVVLILFALTAYLHHLYPHLSWLFVLKVGFEAAAVGAIADTYAVYGLFTRLGPHTDLLRRKRKEISDKVTEFVGEFLLNKEYITKEIEKINFGFVVEQVDTPEVRAKIKDFILQAIKNRKKEYESLQIKSTSSPMVNAIIETVERAFINVMEKKLDEWIEKAFASVRNNGKTAEETDRLIKNYLIKLIEEKHSHLIQLIKNRIDSISDEEFISAVKKASWNELQWIRVNGALLGFVIGLILGTLQLILI